MDQDNKVPQLHCSAGFWHDQIRYLIIYWAQQNGYKVFSEPLGYGKYKPDLVLRQITPTPREFKHRANVVFVEIQKDQKESWVEEKIEQYRGKNLMIVQPWDYPDSTDGLLWDDVYLPLVKQLEMETNAHKPRKKPDKGDEWIVVNGHRCKRKNAWKYRERSK